jgi:peptidoglycan hydrolase-like protein with peptidoglycan-binding domain
MNGRMPRSWRAGDNSRRETLGPPRRRPDRHALWALVLAVFTLAVAAASAHASDGGVGTPGGPGTTSTDPTAPVPAIGTQFGSRVLRSGMTGDDVRVLNGIVKSKSYATGVHVGQVFSTPTLGAVKEFQTEAGLPSDGVVDEQTSSALVHSMDRAGATWYGPGFFGEQTACGTVLSETTIGIAHRTLPCGTKVTLAYQGHYVVAPVIDRGPYAAGYTFDLTAATAQALGVTTSTNLRYAVGQRGSDVRGL